MLNNGVVLSVDYEYSPSFPRAGILERAKHERAWKSPHARKGDTQGVIFTPARVSLALLSLRENGGLLVVYFVSKPRSLCSSRFRFLRAKQDKRDMPALEVTKDTLRNYDGDGKENVKKAIGLMSKTTTLHVHHTFLYTSFLSLHNYDVKWPNFKFTWERERQGDKF